MTLRDIYERDRVAGGAVCHGPIALLNVSLSTGRGLLKEKRVTSFTEAEEEGHSKQDIPFMLDAALRQQGPSILAVLPSLSTSLWTTG